MIRTKIPTLAVAVLMLLACKSGSRGDYWPPHFQSLYDEIMGIHDEVMPQMSKLTILQDSIRAILGALRLEEPQSTEAIRQANTALGALNRAEDSMWAWMHGFSKLDSIPAGDKQNFLEEEKMSVNEMREVFLSGIAQARAYLKDQRLTQ